METIKNTSPETEALLERMKEVRRDLDEGVQEIVEGARDMGKWRSYVTDYPWLCLGVAVAAGYLIVPRRHVKMHADAQTSSQLASESHKLETSPAPPPSSNVRGRLMAFVGDLALRGMSAFLAEQAGQLIASQAAKSSQEVRP